MTNDKTKIIFLNQMAGPLFRELAEDLARIWSPSLLYTGHPHTAHRRGNQSLTIKAATEYDRSSNLKRLVSWLRYFWGALITVYAQPTRSLLFIVSNPPFLGLIGLLFKLLRGQKYVVLVYDIYPDILIGLGRLKNGMLTKVWDFLNRMVWQNSNMVITIGQNMAQHLEKKFDVSRTDAKRVIYIPGWADVNFIKPRSKTKNWFATKYGQVGKITVLYSGNMGNTHDIETILEVARQSANEPEIHFLFIGEGAKWRLVQRAIQEGHLHNITLLPFQPEDVLPYSLSTGDIGIVSYERGTEDYMIPSKAYSYLAAGLALLVISEKENDLTRMVKEHYCGMHVQSGDVNGVRQAIRAMSFDPTLLERYKKAAREAAEKLYSRKNTKLYTDLIGAYICPFR